ncbi:hypothetical protein PENTCL1PPCAC_29511, partial [Pristionchus entomophagus]
LVIEKNAGPVVFVRDLARQCCLLFQHGNSLSLDPRVFMGDRFKRLCHYERAASDEFQQWIRHISVVLFLITHQYSEQSFHSERLQCSR